MQELTKAIRNAADSFSPHEGERETGRGSDVPGADELIEAACAWSAACIRQLNGEAMAKGLEISKAISNFVKELEVK